MSNFILIIFCLTAGVISRKLNWVPKDGYKSLNAWVLYFGLPAISFKFLPKLSWDNSLYFTMLCPLVVLFSSILIFHFIGKLLALSKRTVHTLMLVGGLSNTSFVGFPLITAYYGEASLPIGIVSDQMTFFLLSTIGVFIATKGSLSKSGKIGINYIVKRVFTFPPFIGCMMAIILSKIIDFSFLDDFFQMIASTVSPIALFSIGLQLNFAILKSEIPAITYAIMFKLIFAPLLVFIIALFVGIHGNIMEVSVFEMAMPSLVATSIVLSQFKLNSKIGNSVIGLSIPLSLLSSYLWFQILNYYFGN